MKLAFFIFHYFPFGGLQRDFLRIANAFIARGHTVDIFTTQWQGSKESQMTVTLIPAPGWQNHTRYCNFIKHCQPYLLDDKYDYRVGFNKMPGLDYYYAADLCYQAKAHQHHSFLYRLTPRYRQLIQNERAVFSPRVNTKILSISALQQKEFVRYYKTPQERFYELPPGISKDHIPPPDAAIIRQAVRQEFNIAPEDWCVLMIASRFKTKGLDRALTAIAAAKNNLSSPITFLIIGDDNPRRYDKQITQLKLSDQVKFLGGRNDVPRFLLAADLLLHPAYYETAGMVLLEALVAGLPVLTTDICGYAHYVHQAQAGSIIPSPFQQTQLNQQLIELLNNKKLSRLKQNAINYTQTADIFDMPARVVTLVERGL